MIKTLTDKSDLLIFNVAFATLFLLLQWLAIQAPIGDFGNYYFGSLFLRNGQFGQWVYEPTSFNMQLYQMELRNFFLNYNTLPVITPLTHIPLTWLDYQTAKIVWNLSTAFLLLWSVRRLLNYLNISLLHGLLLIPIFFTPLRANFVQGQAYLLLTSLMIEGYLAHEKGRYWLAALYWGFCIMFKIFPAIILFFLFFENRYRTIWYTLTIIVAGSLLMIPLLGWDVWYTYHRYVLPRVANGELNDTFAFYYQSAQVALRNLFVHDDLHNPNELIHQPWLYIIMNSLFKGVIVCTGAAVASNKDVHSLQRFSLWLMVALLVGGYGTSYGLISFIIPFIALVLTGFSPVRWWLLLVFFLICNIPVATFQHMPEWLQYPRLLCMLLAWVMIISSIRMQWKPVHAALFLLLVVPALFYRTLPEDAYALKKEEALLIYDFDVKPDQLLLKYFDHNGPQEKVIPSPVQATENTPYPFAAHRLGNTKRPQEFIRKAVRINRKQVLYLTDRGRGPGFYTLRILELP